MENKKILIVSLSVVAIIMILGGLVLYISQVNQVNGLRQEVISEISLLSAKIEGLNYQQAAGLNDQSSVTGIPINTSASTAAPLTSVIDAVGIAYSNQIYGFSLQLPKDWAGYTVSIGDRAGRTYASFGMPGWSDIFTIGIYTKETWGLMKKDPVNGERDLNAYIGENNNYVFAMYQSQYVSDQRYTVQRNQFTDIKNSFKALIK
ncbi:MAG: hypothetical protein WC473_01450 [Patescibacteria group bacterium]